MAEFKIRTATMKDLDSVKDIEATCFPAAEAATREALEERLSVYTKGFFVGEIEGKVIGFVNGGSTDDTEIKDEFFETMDLHSDDGKNLVIFGLDVHPDYQHKGYARRLMNHFIEFGKQENKESVILTCKDHLIGYYESFGYKSLGVSDSVHGGAKWYDMVLTLKNK
ncbi:Ribosomal protein S18 acetylase RimI [Dethiosulfatibacter aminovorans DSM 17477]|uniref:Ribosomal protein S18 acetylase RimI n=1 Tax=Dethiosulfatibacter aminovorans DSM 17477 TaxID=1121476 RepID=A0A1M6HNS6_9FIRM|nr:GNAT family N-acetyltransferase [Dethiosulfatibacter aminovorans]SHJ23865.1 Ribosomal protein S18 acetylase RimI [Dethiosulfatibacter aminovorans DSM 17477]